MENLGATSNRKLTLKERTVMYMKEFGSITSLDAIRDTGNTRLSGTIYNLKKDGYVITHKDETAKNRWGDNTTFRRYFLESEHVPSEDEIKEELERLKNI